MGHRDCCICPVKLGQGRFCTYPSLGRLAILGTLV